MFENDENSSNGVARVMRGPTANGANIGPNCHANSSSVVRFFYIVGLSLGTTQLRVSYNKLR